MHGSLDRNAILDALEALSERMRKKRLRAHIYIVGGAAMSLTHRRSHATFDVDALIVDETGSVVEAAREVAVERGLPRDWLNDNVRQLAVMPPAPDRRASTIFDSPHLVVTGASARHMLAMKVHAARDKDLGDITTLVRELGVATMAEVREIHKAVFPHADLPERSARRVSELLKRLGDAGR